MRDNIDVKYRYGEIKLWRDAKNQGEVGVIVEAKADELFFRKSFSKKTCFFSTDGFKNLLELMTEVKENNDEGIIGIIDADFRRITNDKIDFDNLFMTDGHDIEMMTINSQAWNEVLSFHANSHKLDKFEKDNRVKFKKYIFDLSKQIACVRYLNKKQDLGLIFRTFQKGKPNFIDYHKFIDKDNLTIDNLKMIKAIENKSSKQNLFQKFPELKQKLDEICLENYELTEFCNGHDIMNIFAYSIKKALGNENISGIEIENQFIIAYRYDDFKKTTLYKLLRK